MPRFFALALVALAFASPALAADPAVVPDNAPERLLPPTTQLYVRWDGITAHNDAYKKSIWGGVMAGPTGDSIRTVLAKAPQLLGSSVLANPLLEGKSPADLKISLADFKSAEKLVDLIADKGVIVAAEVREPGPTLRGIGQAVGGLIGGKAPGPEALMPDAQLVVIVPDADERSEVLFAALRLAMRQGAHKIEEFSSSGRKGYQLEQSKDAGRGPLTPHAAWWVDGKHFVFYFGTRKPGAVVTEMETSAKKGGITDHPLYKRCLKTGEFESVTRGFVDTAALVTLAKGLAGPFVPGLRERLDGIGLGGLKAVVFSSGFDGKESRALYEFDVPGERKGVFKAIKGEPLGLKDLPPLPPDVSRFSALRLDLSATYDAGLSVVDLLAMQAQFGVEEDAKGGAELVKARKDFLRREVDKFLGITVADDLLPHLGDKLVIFQSPSEGLSVFGAVACVSVKDAAKVKSAMDRAQRSLESLANSPLKVRKKMVKGVEVREFYSRGLGIVTPTYAIVGDWLVMAGHPQPVQGLILREKAGLARWKPDDATAKRLAKLPSDGCGLQYCDPKSTASNLCCIGPLFLGVFALRGAFNESNEIDFDPIDVGLVPNAHELSKHLFPNLTVTRDDGKIIRVEVNESFSLPLEVVGVEPLAFSLAVGLSF